MVVPDGNCHLRGRPALSERPQPLRSTASVPALYSSIQSVPTVDEDAAISLRMTLAALFARSAASMATAPLKSLLCPGVGERAFVQPPPCFDQD